MIIYLRIFAILILVSLSISCMEKEIDYNTIYGGDKIVVHGFISVNKGVEIQVNKTVPPTRIYQNNYLKGAEVLLYEDGLALTTLIEADSGYFVSPADFTAKQNTPYHVEVSAPSFNTVVSKTQYLPQHVPIDSLYYFRDMDSSSIFQIYFSFTDPPEKGNIYSNKYFQYVDGEPVNADDYFEFINAYSVYNDDEFNGQPKTEMRIVYEPYSYPDKQVLSDSVCVLLYTFSPDFYKFAQSVVDYESSNQSALYEQPNTVYSNINGGYGIFAAYSVDSRSVITKKFIK